VEFRCRRGLSRALLGTGVVTDERGAMVRGWKLGRVLLGCAVALQPARGQQSFVVPQTLTISNRDRIFPGLYEFSEAGSVVARVRDAAAIWYNPAVLALADRTTFSASSTGYQLTVLGSATGLEQFAPVMTEQQFASILFATRQVWSGSIGMRLKLSELVTLHGGLYVDPSPVSARINGLFQKADFAGFAPGCPSPVSGGSPGRSASATSGERRITRWQWGGSRWPRCRWRWRSPQVLGPGMR
jgi:hypothetical protein